MARRRRAMSKRELAAAADVSERSLTAWEAGDTTPTPQMLERVAKALGFPVSFFERAEPELLAETGVSFRSLSKLAAGDRARALAGGELALELNAWLEQTFELPAPSVPDLRGNRDSEAAAIALRQQWGLGDKPIAHMVRLLEAKGVRVFSLAEDCHEVDAFSFWRGTRPFVFLNTLKSAERSRFDAAHELGHLVLHRHGQALGREAEQQADAFASAFLMPASSVRAFAPRIPTIPRLIEAKKIWNVALSALVHRMHQLRMVSEWQYRSLFIELQKLGMRKQEPEPSAREMSQVLDKVLQNVRATGSSKQELARALGWPVREINALTFGLILSSVAGGGSAAEDAGPLREKLQLVP